MKANRVFNQRSKRLSVPRWQHNNECSMVSLKHDWTFLYMCCHHFHPTIIAELRPYSLTYHHVVIFDSETRWLGEWFIRSRWVQVSTAIATKAKSTCQIIHFFQWIYFRPIRPAAKSSYVTRIFFFSNSHIFPPFRANIRWIIADFHLYPCDVSLLLNLLSSAMKRFTNWFRNSVEQHD